MGIRFCCPNGHKLNVKAELAGKVGVCPRCGARTAIPTESVFSSEEFRRLKEEPGTTRESASGRGSAQGSSGDVEFDSNVESDRAGRREIGAAFDDSADPLQDPNVVWCVQTPDNRSYGPAPASTLKHWIREKRISPEMFVWREGWDRWEEAGAVFPEVRRIFAFDSDGDGAPETLDEADRADSATAFASLAEAARSSAASRRLVQEETLARRRRDKARRNFGLIAALTGLIVVLSGVLAYVLFFRAR